MQAEWLRNHRSLFISATTSKRADFAMFKSSLQPLSCFAELRKRHKTKLVSLQNDVGNVMNN